MQDKLFFTYFWFAIVLLISWCIVSVALSIVISKLFRKDYDVDLETWINEGGDISDHHLVNVWLKTHHKVIYFLYKLLPNATTVMIITITLIVTSLIKDGFCN